MSRSRKSWAGTCLAVAVAGGVTVGLVPGTAVAAQGAPSLQVIAGKLNNPRGITVLGDGTILVAESGTGGKGPCVGSGEGRQCFGATGSVYRVKGAKKGRVVTGLPSVGGPGEAIGPVDVAVSGKDYIVLNGFGGGTAQRAKFGSKARRMGTLYRVRGGKIYGDLVAHETRLDPDWVLPRTDPGEPSVNANPWRFASAAGGVYVTDAGGNDLLRVSGGKTYTEAIFPHNEIAPAPKTAAASPQARQLLRAIAGPGEAVQGGIPVQSVPTGVVKGPDGALYVGELGGFAPGASRIWRIVPGHRPKVFASGLTAVADLALDGRGNLVALTMTTGFGQNGPQPGALYRINLKTKAKSEIPTGGKLLFPTGLGVGPKGQIYVANNGIGSGAGQLVRVRA
ncbi:hypothetical protein SAMN04489712_104228 [Thermomonospora echinospora]|uniref:ScyD/ScyE family protein n=1 Tax=Thermomonospora echinospora TaxID=1992 RepID=A0A1H5YXN4_9ACTN|nr:ScyD/ScyE family protein [Thermomonospora echinospora]SEG28570.1 hypothetical protein SAMN04489712_104228 [Thermomonospora echinospora]